MLHMILAIVKGIGILILVLLGVLLFLVIAVLSAPVSYRISGGWDGQLKLQGKIHWLYRIVGISICMEDGKPQAQISLFGRRSGSKNTSQKKKASSGKPGKKKQKKSAGSEPGSEKAPVSPIQEEPEDLSGPTPEVLSEPIPEDLSESTPEDRADFLGKKPEGSAQWVEETDGAEPDLDSMLDKALEEDSPVEWLEEEDGDPEAEKKDADGGIFQLLGRALDFWEQPPVKKLAGKLWRSICRIMKHLKPSDLQIQATVGTGDPAYTGKIMELAAVLYAFYGDRIKIVSDFDEKVLEAEFMVKGWLVPGYLLFRILGMALRVLLSKECRAFYREMRQG